MQEQASNPMENFLNAKFLMKDLFGIIMTDEEFIEKAYRGFRKIGNIATATHRYNVVVTECHIKLPCNVEFIESVSTGRTIVDNISDIIIDYEETSGLITSQYYYPDVLSSTHMNRIHLSRTQLHPNGQMVPYELIGKNECIKVDQNLTGVGIEIIYRGQILDEDGLPCLSAKEVEALAYYVAYLDVQKRVFMKEPGIGDLYAIIKPEYIRTLAAAKVPEYLSQNFWDQLLSAKTRMDRKQFGSSYKLIR